MPAIIFAVYALGILTIISFLVFVILLFRYLKQTRTPVTQQHNGAVRADQLQAFEPQKILESLKDALYATAALAKALNDAKPVVLAAVLTILFLLCWLLSLTLLVISRLHS